MIHVVNKIVVKLVIPPPSYAIGVRTFPRRPEMPGRVQKVVVITSCRNTAAKWETRAPVMIVPKEQIVLLVRWGVVNGVRPPGNAFRRTLGPAPYPQTALPMMTVNEITQNLLVMSGGSPIGWYTLLS